MVIRILDWISYITYRMASKMRDRRSRGRA
jgi:hypothetical protein